MKNFESTDHIFLSFPFALKIWNWLAQILHMSINLNSPIDILKTASRGWSPQTKVVVSSVVINILISFDFVEMKLDSKTSTLLGETSYLG